MHNNGFSYLQEFILFHKNSLLLFPPLQTPACTLLFNEPSSLSRQISDKSPQPPLKISFSSFSILFFSFSYLSLSVISDCLLCFKRSLASGDSCQEKEKTMTSEAGGIMTEATGVLSVWPPRDGGTNPQPHLHNKILLQTVTAIAISRRRACFFDKCAERYKLCLKARAASSHSCPSPFHDCGGNRRWLLYMLLTNLTEFSASSVGRLRKMMTQ